MTSSGFLVTLHLLSKSCVESSGVSFHLSVGSSLEEFVGSNMCEIFSFWTV